MMETLSNFLTPLFWPFGHIISTIRLTGNEKPPVLSAGPYLNFQESFSAFGASLRSFLIATFLVYGLYDGYDYPAFGRASVLSISWMWPIIVRNLIGTLLICGFWDWWLYFGPLKSKLFKYKIVPKYPSMNQMRHDVFYTFLSSVLGGFVEIALCHWYAIGAIPMVRSLWDKPILHFILAFTITHLRIPHFYFIHRAMHPWKTDYLPDVGKFLYKQVHSLHHKSYNITAFSGTNMHPIESTLYYTAWIMCIPLKVHPIIALGIIVDCAMGAWIGHDGHVYPGAGDFYHTLHHMHFDCNYGSPHIPLDYLSGVFARSSEDVKRMWGKKASGRDGNNTYVHNDSPSNKVE